MSPATITIAGGGLAGLGLGRALALRGIPVELHEADSYPRHKVCGEFITGLSGETRATLDLEPFLATAREYRTVQWHQRHRKLLDWELPQPALGISRWTLDHELARSFVAAGGRLHSGSRFRLPEMTADPEAAAGLVQATGRLPTTQPRAEGQWIGLKAHLLPPFKLHADLEVHLADNAYVGLNEVEKGRVNVCGLFRKRRVSGDRRAPLLERYLAACGLERLLERISDAAVDESSRRAVAGLDFQRDTPAGGWMRIGDSHGMIPPYTGHGMAMAFESAALALDPLSDFATHKHSWAEAIALVQERHRERFRGRLWRARRLHPVLYQPARQRLIALAARFDLLPMNPLYRLTHA